MLDFAAVPFGGGESYRQALQVTIELLKAVIPANVNTARLRVDGCNANPAILD